MEGESLSFLQSHILYLMETGIRPCFLSWISKAIESALGSLLFHLAWLLSFTLRKTFVSLENGNKYGELLQQLISGEKLLTRKRGFSLKSQRKSKIWSSTLQWGEVRSIQALISDLSSFWPNTSSIFSLGMSIFFFNNFFGQN